MTLGKVYCCSPKIFQPAKIPFYGSEGVLAGIDFKNCGSFLRFCAYLGSRGIPKLMPFY